MIKKILFPVDFSPSCAAIADFVRSVATIFGAKVTLLHVAQLMSHKAFEISVRPVPEIEAEEGNLAQNKLNAFLQAEFPATEADRFLTFGDVADEITHLAKANAFDLVILPTHAGNFRRMVLGSTTAKVLIDADRPVLTAEHAETMAPKPLKNRNWLCAVSLNDDSERVLRTASEAAKATGAKLSVIHAIQVGYLNFPSESIRDDDRDLSVARQARGRVEQLQRKVGLDGPVQITAGPAIKGALVEAVRSSGTDLFIIGRNGQHDLAYQIVRDSPVPVLSL
jgi:nucleotide-binding universal stress UspA family protein